MATPAHNHYIGAMYDFAGLIISQYIRERLATNKRILDVGAGWGKYRFLLPEYEMDAVEVWQPYISQNKLDAYYRKIYLGDITDLDIHMYDVIVMGDVLEHIETEAAKKVVKKLVDHCDLLLIATPYRMAQEAVEDNEHEEHKQPDLTEKIVMERYPDLDLLCTSPYKKDEHIKAIYKYEREGDE